MIFYDENESSQVKKKKLQINSAIMKRFIGIVFKLPVVKYPGLKEGKKNKKNISCNSALTMFH